jgi:hypothetical protein
MPGSYQSINYALRPSKCIERKMLCETFQRFAEFRSLESFRYVGLGSTYFSDFALFHRMLGISNMMSIEKDSHNASRFEFNRPFGCIDLKFGHSNEILPTITWDIPSLVWLDYDDKLDSSILADVHLVSMSALPITALIVTVNSHPDDYDDEHPRLVTFTERIGAEKIPIGLAEKDLDGWGTSGTSRRIITNEIKSALAARNGALASANQIVYKQLFHFRYADGAKMMTVGGLLFDQGQAAMVAKCKFEDLPYIRTGEGGKSSACMIEVPNLTYREIRHLNQQLPRKKRCRVRSPKVSAKDVKGYERIYRHFPHFAETEV